MLYKKTKTGAIQTWEVGVDGNVIVTRHGQLGGAIQETRDAVRDGKNAGRANATTADAQARAEAEARHLKQLKKGYVKDAAAAEAGETDDAVEGGILPMLAHPYEKAADKLTFPCYVQPKLDGHRCVAQAVTGELWTRTRRTIPSVPHIARAVGLLKDVVWLDGELYNHDYHDNFEQLTSLLRKAEPAPGHEVIQYHVYDLPGPGTFAARWAALAALSKHFDPSIHLVETILVNDEAQMWAAYQRFRDQGYEGAIARNADGLYVGSRSGDLLKLKEFQEAEFVIVGLEEGRGKLAGHCGAFVCALPSGATFNAKMVGPTAALKAAWEDQGAWLRKSLTVRFQDYTKDGVPRFPRGLRLRTDL